MIQMIIQVYRFVFARKIFSKFNNFLFLLALHGVGILNYENNDLSGEKWFLQSYFQLLGNKKLLLIDVGANHGDYSELLKLVRPTSTVLAFEPHPKTYLSLSKRAKQHSFKAINYGLSNKSGTLRFYDYKEYDGSTHASIYKNVIERIHKKQSTSHSIKVTTLDSYLSKTLEGNKKIHLLKVDTEGHEYAVLQGARKLIDERKIDVIQFEFNDMNIESKVFLTDFMRLLDNYVFFRVLPHSLISIQNYSPLFIELFAFQNIIAIRKDLKSVIKYYA